MQVGWLTNELKRAPQKRTFMRAGKLIELSDLQPFRTRSAIAQLPDWVTAGDDERDLYRSTLRLFEDGVEIGPAHMNHDAMDEQANGGYSHWGARLFFTSSTGESPLDNGRRYTALVQGPRPTLSDLFVQIETGYPENVGSDTGYVLVERIAQALAPGEHLSERARSFFKDDAFRAQYERFDTRNYRSYDRKFAMQSLARYAARLPGDMAECGVYRGGTAWFMAEALRAAGRPGAMLHLFDSFEGLSKPSAIDGDHWRAGDLAMPLEEVRRLLAPQESVIQYWPGWIPHEFSQVRDRRFSLVHIDVDLAEPTWDALAFFYPRLVQHGLIVCDDYGFDTCPGARQATDTYFAERNLPVIHLPTGQGLVIKTEAG